MRTTLVAALAALCLSATAHADLVDVDVHSGVSTVNMAQVNRSNAALWGWDVAGQVDDLDSAWVSGVDFSTRSLTPYPWLELGLRVEYLQTNEAIVDDPEAPTYITEQGKLSSALVGAKVSAPFAAVDGLSAGLGAWFGYGYATFEQNVTTQTVGGPGSAPLQSELFRSSIIVTELEGRLQYQLTRHWALGVTGGWRWADAGLMKDPSGDLLSDNLQLWEYGNKAPINVDFSGITAQGSLSYSF
jgi:hypothetical protein